MVIIQWLIGAVLIYLGLRMIFPDSGKISAGVFLILSGLSSMIGSQITMALHDHRENKH